MYTNESCGEHAIYFRWWLKWHAMFITKLRSRILIFYHTVTLHKLLCLHKNYCKLTVYLTWWSLELQTSAASSVMLHDKHHSHSVWLTRKWMTNLKRKGCLYTCTWKHIAFLSRSVARKLKWVVFFRLHPFLVHEP